MSKNKQELHFGQPHIGKMIREEIRQQQLGLKAFARGIGVHPASVVKMLRNQDFRLYRLRDMSRFLGVDYIAELSSDETHALIQAGQTLPEVEENLKALEADLKEKEAQIQQLNQDREAQETAHQSGLATAQSQWEARLQALQEELEKEKAARLEAEIQVKVLEGKLEVYREVREKP